MVKIKFSDVAGMDEAKQEIMEFVNFLKAPQVKDAFVSLSYNTKESKTTKNNNNNNNKTTTKQQQRHHCKPS